MISEIRELDSENAIGMEFTASGQFAQSGERWEISGAPITSKNRAILYLSSMARPSLVTLLRSERRENYRRVAEALFTSQHPTHGIRITKDGGECLFVRACDFTSHKNLTTRGVFLGVCNSLARLALEPDLESIAQMVGRDSFLFWHSALVACYLHLHGELDRRVR